MRYGLEAGRPLLSHVWAAPLLGRHFNGHDPDQVLATYLAEPMMHGGHG